jgi:hypothetical protein
MNYAVLQNAGHSLPFHHLNHSSENEVFAGVFA